jgi:mono/diheme cytochrome c family protein
MKRKLLILFPLFVFFILVGWQPSPVPKIIMDRGKKVYDQHCLSCHMDNGLGAPRMSPSLSKSKFVVGTKTKAIRIVLRGSDEFADMPERNFKNPMAPLNNLNDQQIADVLTYIRNSFGNKARIITPGDVKYVRAKTKI